MTIDKLIKYFELIQELRSSNHVYDKVNVEIPDETILTETWYDGEKDHFHSIEFQLKDMDFIYRKIYDKVRYIKSKSENS